MYDIPLFVVTLTIWAYWLRVGAMVVRARHRQHRDVGVIPERPVERAMWLVWVPLVTAWAVLPLLAMTHSHGSLALPEFARAVPGYEAIRWLAALAAAVCFALTLRSWRRMGGDWRMDISDRNTTLITDGMFARIRHPIYAFSIGMMLATAVVLPTLPMLCIAVLHVVMMNIKARNEEAHLARIHGDAYARYVERTGRFLPRPLGRDA